MNVNRNKRRVKLKKFVYDGAAKKTAFTFSAATRKIFAGVSINPYLHCWGSKSESLVLHLGKLVNIGLALKTFLSQTL